MKTGIEIIADERTRQINEEGRSVRFDADSYSNDELASAAAAYASPARQRSLKTVSRVPVFWPWSNVWWKPAPNDRVRELAKAGALIAAEIDRIQYREAQKNA